MVRESKRTQRAWCAEHSRIVMKITKIKLGSYLHFEPGLEIDLTYPLGHAKAGRPLQKVCILGQSGTGKTALLNVIKCCVCEDKDFNKTGIDKSAFMKDGIELFYRLNNTLYSKVSAGDLQFTHVDHSDPNNPKEISYPKL